MCPDKKYQSQKKNFHLLVKSETSLRDKIKDRSSKIKSLLANRTYMYQESLMPVFFAEDTERALINKGLDRIDFFSLFFLSTLIVSAIMFFSLSTITLSPFLISAGSLSESNVVLLGCSIALGVVSLYALFLAYLGINFEEQRKNYLFSPLKLILKGIIKGELSSVLIPILKRRADKKTQIKDLKSESKTLNFDLENVKKEIVEKTGKLKNDSQFIEYLKAEYSNLGTQKKYVFKSLLN
jgi:hypothetical protein